MRVGILALQGDVREHAAALHRLGAEPVEIRTPDAIDHLDALVLPGGESTTISLLLDRSGLRARLAAWVSAGRPTLGTCAGLVLLADEVLDGRPDQRSIGGLPIAVRRNGFGRQRYSFEAEVQSSDGGEPFEAGFIRAPRIERVLDGTTVLAELVIDGSPEPVVVESGHCIGCSFHPELAGDDRLHRRLLELAETTTAV